MTDRFKDVLCAFRRFHPVYNEDGELGQIDAYQLFTKDEFETIVYGLHLATESEQLRKENSMLKQVNDLLLKEGHKIPFRIGRSIHVEGDYTTVTDAVYITEPEFKEQFEQLRKENEDLKTQNASFKKTLIEIINEENPLTPLWVILDKYRG